eukprot:CAMPEP_0184314860 /NCGR_PEP_ID=MMETSP1049-20130417/77859_1 /TAXON_ID=77928 /ORGANISM="Proteomonas sulcata, Strain CCMP704" /LENGTH=62 /DNA_ID=CAMNT_0026633017 /DNA_START=178 /DNA_END=366 /DNA_ORIENTATION=+
MFFSKLYDSSWHYPACRAGMVTFHDTNGGLWQQPFCDPGTSIGDYWVEPVQDVDTFDYHVGV